MKCRDVWEFTLKYVRRKYNRGYEEESAASEKQQPVRQEENQKNERSWKPNELSVSFFVASHTPLTVSQPRHVPWLGIEPMIFWFSATTQSTEPHQPGLIRCFMEKWSVLSNTARRSRKMRITSWPLHLVIWKSLVTFTKAVWIE